MRHNKEGVLLNGMYYLWKNGYHASGINDILQSCDIPKGSFYNMFTTKEDFCVEALELYCNMLHTSMEEYLTDKEYLPLDRLKNFYMYQIEQSIEEGAIRGCMMCNLSLEMGAASKKVRKELTQQLHTNWQLIEKCVTEAENKGMVTDSISASQAATLIQNNWFGALLKTKATGKVEALNAFLVDTFEIITSFE